MSEQTSSFNLSDRSPAADVLTERVNADAARRDATSSGPDQQARLRSDNDGNAAIQTGDRPISVSEPLSGPSGGSAGSAAGLGAGDAGAGGGAAASLGGAAGAVFAQDTSAGGATSAGPISQAGGQLGGQAGSGPGGADATIQSAAFVQAGGAAATPLPGAVAASDGGGRHCRRAGRTPDPHGQRPRQTAHPHRRPWAIPPTPRAAGAWAPPAGARPGPSRRQQRRAPARARAQRV